MIFEELEKIFREVFENPDMEITHELSAADVDDWTSLVHMQLLAAVEEHFEVTFSTRDIRKMKKVGDLVSCIEQKKG